LPTHTILPLDIPSHTVVHRVDPWHTPTSLVVVKSWTGSLYDSCQISVKVTIFTARMAVGCMLIDLALVMVIEAKAYVIGTASIGDDKVIARCTLAAVQVAVSSRFSNTDAIDTRGTGENVNVITVQTVYSSFTLCCHGHRASSSLSSSRDRSWRRCWLFGGRIRRSSCWLFSGAWSGR
jgi:hypothetical protein